MHMGICVLWKVIIQQFFIYNTCSSVANIPKSIYAALKTNIDVNQKGVHGIYSIN